MRTSNENNTISSKEVDIISMIDDVRKNSEQTAKKQQATLKDVASLIGDVAQAGADTAKYSAKDSAKDISGAVSSHVREVVGSGLTEVYDLSKGILKDIGTKMWESFKDRREETRSLKIIESSQIKFTKAALHKGSIYTHDIHTEKIMKQQSETFKDMNKISKDGVAMAERQTQIVQSALLDLKNAVEEQVMGTPDVGPKTVLEAVMMMHKTLKMQSDDIHLMRVEAANQKGVIEKFILPLRTVWETYVRRVDRGTEKVENRLTEIRNMLGEQWGLSVKEFKEKDKGWKGILKWGLEKPLGQMKRWTKLLWKNLNLDAEQGFGILKISEKQLHLTHDIYRTLQMMNGVFAEDAEDMQSYFARKEKSELRDRKKEGSLIARLIKFFEHSFFIMGGIVGAYLLPFIVPIEIVSKAFRGIIIPIELLVNSFDSIIGFAKKLKRILKIPTLSLDLTRFFNLISSIANAVKKIPVIGKVVEPIRKFIGYMKEIGAILKSDINKGFRTFVIKPFKMIVKVFKMVKNVGSIIGKVYESISGVAKSIADSKLFKKIFNNIFMRAFKKGFKILGWPITALFAVIDFLKGFRDEKGDFMTKISSGISAAFTGFFKLPIDLLGYALDWIYDKLGMDPIPEGSGAALMFHFKEGLDWFISKLMYYPRIIWEKFVEPYEGTWTEKLGKAVSNGVADLLLWIVDLTKRVILSPIKWLKRFMGFEEEIPEHLKTAQQKRTELLRGKDDKIRQLKDFSPEERKKWDEYTRQINEEKGIKTKTPVEKRKERLDKKKELIDRRKELIDQRMSLINGRSINSLNDIEMKTLKSISKQIKELEKQTIAQETSAKALEMGTKPKSFYTHDVHVEELLKSIYKAMLRGGSDYFKSSTSTPAYGSYKSSGKTTLPADRLREGMGFFMSPEGGGFSKEQAAAIMGNLMTESGLKPKAHNKAGGGRGAKGIAQWRGSRLRDFEKWFGAPIEQSTYTDQLRFMAWEFRNTERKAYEKIKNSKGWKEASKNTSKYYERDEGLTYDRREKFTESALNQINKLETVKKTGSKIDEAKVMAGKMMEEVYKKKKEMGLKVQQTRDAMIQSVKDGNFKMDNLGKVMNNAAQNINNNILTFAGGQSSNSGIDTIPSEMGHLIALTVKDQLA